MARQDWDGDKRDQDLPNPGSADISAGAGNGTDTHRWMLTFWAIYHNARGVYRN